MTGAGLRYVTRGAVAIGLLVTLPGRAHAAPTPATKKQCIAAAESAQQLRVSGHLLDARKALGQCTAAACPAVVRHDCGVWLEEIDAALPTVAVKLEDDGGDVLAGRVLVDGEVLARGDGRALPLDPGPHRFVWARSGGDVEQELVLREGERNRVVVLRASGSAPRPEVGPPPADHHAHLGPLPIVVGGAGVALGVVAGVLWGIGLNDRANMVTGCARTHGCTEDEVSASHAKLVAGDVLMGAGVVAVAAAVVLYLTRDHGSPPAPAGPVGMLPGLVF
ncbi:MAG: hypothetical protein JWP97_1517 [Labilithrix sp.]|nr:hypothetical protein [Labilithrix sp.]